MEGGKIAEKRGKPKDIALQLRQDEVLQGQGRSVQEAVRQIEFTVQTYCRWRREYFGMTRDQLERARELETEKPAPQARLGTSVFGQDDPH